MVNAEVILFDEVSLITKGFVVMPAIDVFVKSVRQVCGQRSLVGIAFGDRLIKMLDGTCDANRRRKEQLEKLLPMLPVYTDEDCEREQITELTLNDIYSLLKDAFLDVHKRRSRQIRIALEMALQNPKDQQAIKERLQQIKGG